MTMVFLHGIGGGAATFELLAPRVPDALALDLPGFGDEPWEAQATFPRLADWLAAKLDALGIGRAELFGHSLGGMLALEMAATRPDRVRAITLCCTTPAFGGRDESFRDAFLAARLGPLDRGASMADLGAQSARAMMAPEAPDAARAIAAAAMGRVPEKVFRDILECLTTFNRRAALADLSAPTLALAGDRDMAAPARTMRRMAEAIPDARFVELPGGHFLPLEQPEMTAAAVADFRKSLEEKAT